MSLKLLIIDDEVRTREFLHHRIAWESLGITMVESVKNGILALDMARDWMPDIILCDIRMPKMDGIEFAKRLRMLDSDAKLIFLSGFSDKEYLLSAIQLQAFQFIEKPINPGRIKEVVGEAVRVRQTDLDKQKEGLRLQASFDENLPILRREMVRKLVTEPHSPHVLPALLNRDTFLIPSEGRFTVVVAPLFWRFSDIPKEVRIVQEEILSSLSKSEEMLEWGSIAGFDSQNWLVILMPGTYGSAYMTGWSRLEQLRGVLRRILGPDIQFHMGIGHTAEQLFAIPDAYHSAVNAGNLQFYKDYGEIAFPSEKQAGEPLDTDWEELKRFRESVRRGDVEQADKIIQGLTKRARQRKDLDIMRVKDVYFQFLLILLEIALQQGLTDKEEGGGSRYIWREIDIIPDLDRLHRYVLSLLALFDREEGKGGSGKMREIVKFIHTHFHEKGFGIQMIADHVGLSETYLCSFFKKQSGQTVKEYMTGVRVEKAKELLREQDMKLYTIAQAVGFADPNYFTTFFKKYAGCTPTEYRERVGQ
ncbi:helix-turn-helix domain-containing protein [Candidatus Pristimantibacillus sp. PTI5]|uniref:response regulator transcription factor n=1 Tax=Candidatus Pristimantibacillus sp. PTI5 TaxID=3400422 RepID=UPI003B01F68F